MEVRNQFAHNSFASSFKSLDDYISGLSNYLKKECPGQFDNDIDEENQLKNSFYELCGKSLNRLVKIAIEYSSGKAIQVRRYVHDIGVQNMSTIAKNAASMYQEFAKNHSDANLNIELQSMIHSAIFTKCFFDYTNLELDKIDVKDPDIYKQKETMEQILERYERAVEKKGIIKLNIRNKESDINPSIS